MSLLTLIAHWLGFGFALLAVMTAIGAAMARAHFVMIMFVAVTAIFAGVSVLALGAAQAALALVVVGAAIVPVLLLGGVLLSGRAIRSKPRGETVWLLALAGIAAALIVWASQDLATPPLTAPVTLGDGAWLAPLLLVTAVICAGLLGYGERGALGRRIQGQRQ